MKRILQLLLLSVLVTPLFAQRRYHPENLSNYNTTSTGNQHRIGSRATAPLACTGSPKVPVILVQFSDKEFCCDTVLNKQITHSDENVRAFYDKFCNGSDDPNEDYRFTIGSLGYTKQYFSTVSSGLFTPEFVVIGPVTLPKSWEYYGKDTSKSSKDVNIREFYSESLKLAIQKGGDLSQFDNNNDGKIDFVFFIFAGEGQNAYGNIQECEEEGNPEKAHLIWPKEHATDFQITTDGKTYTFGGYGCTNEMYYKNVDGIGTMCHELSHGLGLPDMYDTNYIKFGMDYWDVMDAGNYSLIGRAPVEYSAYERDFMGWRMMETLSLTEGQTIRIEPIEQGGKGYKLINPANTNEYYIIENRQEIGFDFYYGWVSSEAKKKYGANRGLLITHVDYNANSWSTNTVNYHANHQRITPLPADGELISSIPGYDDTYFASMAGDLYPGSQNVTTIAPSRFKLETGGNLPTEVTNIIQNEDLSITLELNGGDKTAIEGICAEGIKADESTIYDLSGRVVEHPSKGIYIKGGKKYFVK